MEDEITKILADRAEEALAGRVGRHDVMTVLAGCVETGGETEYHAIKAIRLTSFGSSATSVRPRNLIVNWKKLFLEVGPTSILSADANADVPWRFALAALVIGRSVLKGLTVEIPERPAALLWRLWRLRSRPTAMMQIELLTDLNNELVRRGMVQMTPSAYRDALNFLEEIGCIEVQPDGNVWLNDEIVVPMEW